MNEAFWSNPPWSSGNGHYQMSLNPIAETVWCNRRATPAEQQVKRDLLKHNTKTVLQVTEESQDAQRILSRELAKRHDLADATDLDLPASAKTAHALVASALTVPEDLCLLQRPQKKNEQDYRLVAACVCAPSYWHLPDKIGLGLHEVHNQVPGLNQALGKRIAEFFNKLPSQRVFMRRNWFVHSSSERFQPHPEGRREIRDAAEALSLVIRVETQTLRRLSNQVVAFTIAVDCYPLAEISGYPNAASALKQALLSKSPDERTAAGQTMYEQGVIDLVDQILANKNTQL